MPIRFFLPIFAVALTWAIVVPTTLAQDKSGPGSQGAIHVDRLVQLIDEQGWIDGYEIVGDDLTKAMMLAEPGKPVRIRNAVIIGPVRLTKDLPGMFLRDLEDSETADLIQSVWLRNGYSYRMPILILDRQLLIDNSRLVSWSAAQQESPLQTRLADVMAEPAEDPDQVFDGERVYFKEGLFVTRSQVVGSFSAPAAVFTGQSTFWDTAFEGDVNFHAATFLTLDRSILSYIPLYYNLRPFPGRPYGFDRARFAVGASYEGAYFRSEAGFRSTAFAGQVRWDQAEFADGADFNMTRFGDVANFSKTRFAGTARFASATFEAEPVFEETRFEGPAGFTDANFKANVGFSTATFSDTVDFSAVSFHSNASFVGNVFPRGAVFERGVFDGVTLLPGAAFEGEANFRHTQFNRRIELNDARFRAGADFFDTEFQSEISAGLAEFAGETTFAGALFRDAVFFDLAVFKGPVNLSNTHFMRPLYLRGATFEDSLRIENLLLDDYGDFRGASIATLHFDSSPRPSFVAGRMDFRSAHIGTVCLSDVTFLSQVDFSDATIGERGSTSPKPDLLCGRITEVAVLRDLEAGIEDPGAPELSAAVDFVSVTFAEDVSFLRTRFKDSVKFEQVRANKLADFTGATFRDVGSFTLSFSSLRNLKLSWRQLPEVTTWRRIQIMQPLSEVFSELEGQFRGLGQLDDANAARYHAKRSRLEALRHSVFADDWRAWRSPVFTEWVAAEAEWWVWGLLSGYGTKLWWCLGWAAVFVLLFAVAFALSGSLLQYIGPSAGEYREWSAFKQRVFAFPGDFCWSGEPAGQVQEPGSKLRAGLQLSGVILLKAGPRDVLLWTRGQRWPLHLLRLEWTLGYYLVAVLVYTLSETWPLLNRLLAGIF